MPIGRKRSSYVVLLSGGVDSATLLYDLYLSGADVIALTVDYGQRHRQEIEAAKAIVKRAGIEHVVLPFRETAAITMEGSSQTTSGIAVPHGHYTDASMAVTVVPNRNMVLLALAGALAASRHMTGVAIANHAGDHAIYADCRPEFVDAMFTALDKVGLGLIAPYTYITKADIVALGAELNVPFGITYSCYEGREGAHCGQCGTCVERREAFQLACIADPTVYLV